jgi:DNA-binding HxlR family transcriptional regulator
VSEQQQRFDDLMKRVIKVTPEELKRRLKAEKTGKSAKNGINGDGNNK